MKFSKRSKSLKIFPNMMVKYTFILIVLLQFFSIFHEINTKSLQNKNFYSFNKHNQNQNFSN